MSVPKIGFTPSGSILIYEEAHQLQCWHLRDRRLLHQHEGTLLGIAKHGRSFLLYTSHGTAEAHASLTGTQLPIQEIAPQDYTAGQHYKLHLKRTSIEIMDMLRNEVIYTFQLADLLETVSKQDSFSNVCLPQDGSFMAVTIVGDSTWGEWARGYCLPLTTGKTRFEFSVNRFVNHPLLETVGGYLLVESATQEQTLWEIQTGKVQQTFTHNDPQAAKHLLAVNTAEFPPIIALWVNPYQVGLYQTGLPYLTLTVEQEILHAEFFPDNRHIALLLENKTVSFFDWRTGHDKGSLSMV